MTPTLPRPPVGIYTPSRQIEALEKWARDYAAACVAAERKRAFIAGCEWEARMGPEELARARANAGY